MWRPLAAAAILGLAVTATLLFRDGPPRGGQASRDHGVGGERMTAVDAPGIKRAVDETSVAEVTVNRAGWRDEAPRESAVAVVTVSQRMPRSPMVTVAPPPRGRIMIVPVNDPEENALASFEDDDAGAYF
jgi:hypothetical protein